MAYAALGKDVARTDRSDLAERFLSSNNKELNTYEREALDHITHASDALVIPIYALTPLTPYQIERIISEVKDPDYVEGSGMRFKVVRWRGDGKGGRVKEGMEGKRGLTEREVEVEMVRIAQRKRKGLLVFADEGTVAGEGVRISNYEIWDDGWGEEEEVDGKKGEGIKYGRVGCSDLSRVYTDVAAGTADVEKLIVGGPSAKKVVRWGRLETF